MKHNPLHRRKADTISPSSSSSSSTTASSSMNNRNSFQDETAFKKATNDIASSKLQDNRSIIESTPTSSLWTDILVFSFVIVGFASLSIFVGIAAGFSISIHYFEGIVSSSDPRRLMMEYYGLPGYSLRQSFVTKVDMVAASHVDTVISTTPYGTSKMYMVVQESPGIKDDEATNMTASNRMVNQNDHDVYPAPKLQWEEWRTQEPRNCASDPNIQGYQTYREFKQAVEEVNRYSSERYDRWNEYFDRLQIRKQQQLSAQQSMVDTYVNLPAEAHYQEPITLTICPHITLYGLYGPIFINTESLTITCDGCVMANWGSHFSFGPSARNVRIVGLTFRHATSSSMSFPYDGADVLFEHCRWENNCSRNPNHGSVLDMHSKSGVQFFRSFVSQPRPKNLWRRGYQTAALSIRS